MQAFEEEERRTTAFLKEQIRVSEALVGERRRGLAEGGGVEGLGRGKEQAAKAERQKAKLLAKRERDQREKLRLQAGGRPGVAARVLEHYDAVKEESSKRNTGRRVSTKTDKPWRQQPPSASPQQATPAQQQAATSRLAARRLLQRMEEMSLRNHTAAAKIEQLERAAATMETLPPAEWPGYLYGDDPWDHEREEPSGGDARAGYFALRVVYDVQPTHN